MIYPIEIYGSSVLRKKSQDIEKNYENLSELIENMWTTMYSSDGVGLAAPQIGKSIRLIVIDGTPMEEEDENVKDFKKVFINALITERTGENKAFTEGCLSIPKIREDVIRPSKIRIEYYDENFNFHDERYDGIAARIIQHEYDHTEGILFTDKISPIKKRLLKGKLNSIKKGKFNVDYRYKFSK
ncbi:MAG: peptide deformylase [Bacteroidales bacterium]|jgi:peptide deformylase|nr:peptide deformylase [Bacteroidales bacterium]